MAKRQTTLADVSSAAGIHPSAVSRVLRGQGDALRLSERRQNEIREVAARLGYRPNLAARATASGKFGSIALVCAHGRTTSTLPQIVLYGLIDALAEKDTQLVACRLSDAALTDESQLPLFLRQHACDGLIMNYTHCVPQGVHDLIARYRIPAIWLNVKQECDCVHPDDFAAGRNATQWLIERGHRRIVYAHLGVAERVDPIAHYSVADRQAGYKAAMADAGLSPQLLLDDALETDEACVERLRELLDSDARPTALLGYSREPEEAFVAAQQLGLRVPDDLELVAINEQVRRVGGIRIPTVRLPSHTLGTTAAIAIAAKVRTPSENIPEAVVPCDPYPVMDSNAVTTANNVTALLKTLKPAGNREQNPPAEQPSKTGKVQPCRN